MLDPNRWRDKAPPNPVLFDQDANQGQQLLALVRSLENEDNDKEHIRILEDASEILARLLRHCAMRGLLQGNHQKANNILSSGPEATSHDTLKKKRGRKRGNQKGQANSGGESSTAAATMDENLIISALIRILGLSQTKLQSALGLAWMSADLCTAISEHLKSKSSQHYTRIGLAEYELMSSSGIPLLKGLYKASTQMIGLVRNNLQNETLVQAEVFLDTNLEDYDDEIETLKSCFRAAATLVSLFGSKLSRSSGLVSDWQKLGLTTLTLPCHDIQIAASKLLAALPLTGALYDKKAASKKSIGEEWSDFLMDAVVVQTTVIRTMAPVSQKIESSSNSWQVSKPLDSFLDNVKAFFHEKMPQETLRASAFRVLIHGLSQLILSIIARDYRCPQEDGRLLDARISVKDILDLLECMLFFSFASESLFFKTKKRLRLEVIEGGLLSPASVVNEVASYVKLLGHQLFDAMVSAVGHPSLLPHSNRILRMVSGALLSSSSSAVQKAVDSSVAAQLEGKGKRWLHTSVLLRSKAVQSFSVAISMFGLDPTRNSSMSDASSWLSPHQSSGAEKSVSVVGGCLLEQLQVDANDSCDWGTFEERVGLAKNAVLSLQSILLSCGGFMPLLLRVLVESVAAGGLEAIVAQDANPIAKSTIIMVAILRLGSVCVSAPWPSGASSSLRERLAETSHICMTHDTETSAAAASALRVCESLGTPRVPALFVDKQVHAFSASIKPVSAGSLMNDIHNSKAELDEREEQASAELKPEDGEEEGKRKRRKKEEEGPIEAGRLEQRSAAQSVERDIPEVAVNEPTDNDQATSNEKEAIEAKKPSFPPAVRDTEDEKAQEKGGLAEEEDDDDFLPGIVDDGGPDEEDA